MREDSITVHLDAYSTYATTLSLLSYKDKQTQKAECDRHCEVDDQADDVFPERLSCCEVSMMIATYDRR